MHSFIIDFNRAASNIANLIDKSKTTIVRLRLDTIISRI